MKIVVLGLSLSSSWGNGHATTYRSLLRALHRRGHSIHFLERDQEWYVSHRDLPDPDFCCIDYYASLNELRSRFDDAVIEADVVILGSYVPEGVAIGTWLTEIATGVTAFYDIDTPVTLQALERRDCDYISERLIPEFDLYLSFSGGPALEALKQVYGARSVHPLYCSAEVESARASRPDLKYDLGYLGTYSADRQPALEQLLLKPAAQSPHLDFVVAGAQFPACIVWPENTDYMTHIVPSGHVEFYRSQRFTLNVTRQAMVSAGYSPSVRLFEAAACGVPVISDHWEGLANFFAPGLEILVARSSADVCAFLHDLPESERQAIAQRAQSRFLREHTPDCRAAQFEEWIRAASQPATTATFPLSFANYLV